MEAKPGTEGAAQLVIFTGQQVQVRGAQGRAKPGEYVLVQSETVASIHTALLPCKHFQCACQRQPRGFVPNGMGHVPSMPALQQKAPFGPEPCSAQENAQGCGWVAEKPCCSTACHSTPEMRETLLRESD